MFSFRISGFHGETAAYENYFKKLLEETLNRTVSTEGSPIDLEIVLFPYQSLHHTTYKILLVGEPVRQIGNESIQDARTGVNGAVYHYPSYHILGSIQGDKFWPFAAWHRPGLGSPEQVMTERAEYLTVPKERFCSVVRVHGDGDIRNKLFTLLNEYRRVDSAGPWNNNMPNKWRVPGIHSDKELSKFYSSGKFVLACENSSAPGYVTEKIMNAYRGGSVPIYWGTSQVSELFNPESFIDMNKFDSVEAVVEYVKKLDNDDEAYQKILNAPIWNITSGAVVPRPMTSHPFTELIEKIFLVKGIEDMTLSDGTPEAYVINLSERKDRWEQLTKNFNSVNCLKLKRFEAIRHHQGATGCALSMQTIIKNAKDKGLPYVIIMEDDCMVVNVENFNVRFPKVIEWLTSNMNQWSVFNGGPHIVKPYNVFETVSDIPLIKIDAGYGFQFMIYNSNAYDMVLSYNPIEANLFDSAIDVFVSRHFYQHTSVPYLVIPYPSISDICNGSMSDYTHSFKESEMHISNGPVDRLPVGYVINMQPRPDRWDHIRRTFNDVKSLRLLRVEATRHTNGAFGCFLSHQKIVRMAKNKKLPYVIVVEDDCKILNPLDFDRRFPQIIKWLDEHMDQWQVFNIAPTNTEVRGRLAVNSVDKSIPLIRITFGYVAHFIIYNSSIYDWILEQKPGIPLDVLMNKYTQLTSVPYMAFQQEFYSDIQKYNVNYDEIFISSEKRIMESLAKLPEDH